MKLLQTYLESCASIVQAVVAARPTAVSTKPVIRRCSLKSVQIHASSCTVATAVSHKHHLSIRVGAGLIQFVYKFHSRLATELTLDKSLFSPWFSQALEKSLRQSMRVHELSVKPAECGLEFGQCVARCCLHALVDDDSVCEREREEKGVRESERERKGGGTESLCVHEFNAKFVERGLRYGQFVALHLLNALVGVDKCVRDGETARKRERIRERESVCTNLVRCLWNVG